MGEHKNGLDRIPIAGQVTGEVTVFQPMTILDMSEGGVQIETAFALHIDSLHDFRLSLGERSVIVKGRIANSQVGGVAQGTVRYRTGVEFIEPSTHVRLAIRDFVEALRSAREVPPIVDAELADEV